MSGGHDRRAVIVAGYLALALTLGGGGSPNPWSELAVQLGGAAFAVWWLASGEGGVWREAPVELRCLAMLVVAVPLLHLVPVPPGVWQALSGRELARGSLALVGADDTWRPLSVAPHLTLASLVATIPPVVLMLAAARLDRQGVRLCLMVVAGAALVSALLGAGQLASGGGLRLYAETHRDWITGVFANRNAAVDLFLIGSLAATACAIGAAEPRRWWPAVAVVQIVLLLAAVLTGSRAGILLIVIVAAVQLVLRRPAVLAGKRLLIAAAAGLAAAAGAAILLETARLAAVRARFGEAPGFRVELWRDAWSAAQGFFPAGSGVGTFTRAFAPFERLEVLDATVPNRAHNDYLELLIEIGALAPLLLAAAAVLLVHLWRRRRGAWEHRLFAAGTLLILALHSLVDYPLRTMALASLAALATGMLASPGYQRQRPNSDGSR